MNQNETKFRVYERKFIVKSTNQYKTMKVGNAGETP